jgi:anti-anti-sigma factor
MNENPTGITVEEVPGTAAAPVLVLRLSGDITSASRAVLLGTYQGLPPIAHRILLDFTRVDYLNSSGIALIIQVLIEAGKAEQVIQIFGLKPHFQKIFTMVGITKYTAIYSDEQSACAAFAI